jgi:hypothetical protein
MPPGGKIFFSPFRFLFDLVLAVAIGAGDENRAQLDIQRFLIQFGPAVLAFQNPRIHRTADVNFLFDDYHFLFSEGHEQQQQRYRDQQQADGQTAGDQKSQSHEKNNE